MTALLAAAVVASLPPGGRFEETLQFGGEAWQIKESDTEVIGPGPNRFLKENAWVDGQGRLHLRIARTETGWSSAEVRCARSLGYGTAKVTCETAYDAIDPNAVFGFFTWSDDTEQNNREIDIEVSRWGQRNGPNLHLTTQPGPTAAFNAAAPTAGSELTIDWRPGRAELSSVATDGMELGKRAFTHAVPTVGGDVRLRFNLWLFRGNPPMDGQPTEVILSNFSFTPLPAEAR